MILLLLGVLIAGMYGAPSYSSQRDREWQQQEDLRRQTRVQHENVRRDLGIYLPLCRFDASALPSTYVITIGKQRIDAWSCDLKQLRRLDKAFKEIADDTLHHIRTYRILALRHEAHQRRKLQSEAAQAVQKLASMSLHALSTKDLEALVRLTQ